MIIPYALRRWIMRVVLRRPGTGYCPAPLGKVPTVAEADAIVREYFRTHPGRWS